VNPVPDADSDPLVRRVIEVIAARQGKLPAAISVDSTFAQLGLDSLDAIHIVFALEESYGINIPDDAVREITSVQMAVDHLRQLVGTAGAGDGAESSAAR